jgi:ABC-type nitrate/sulfonate/bicarbonate transport system substrate-binding protein
MNVRTAAAALLLLTTTSGGLANAADRPVIRIASVTQEVEAWCLSTGFMYAPAFLPGALKAPADFETVLLSPPQAVIAVNAGDVAMDECTSLGSVTQAWKQGAHNVVIVAVTGIEPVYSLIGAKGLKRLDELKGKTLGANGMATTATQAVIAILQKGANLMPERDYTFVSAATGSARVAALISGKIDGISSYPPYSYKLADDGYPILAGERQFVPNYVQGVLAVNRDWASKNRPVLVATLKTMLQAGKWLKDPKKKDEIIAKLADNMTMAGAKVGTDYARRIYSDVIAVNGGVVDGLYGDRALFTSTLDLLAERGLIAKSDYPPLDKAVDYSYLNAARRELGMPAVRDLGP